MNTFTDMINAYIKLDNKPYVGKYSKLRIDRGVINNILSLVPNEIKLNVNHLFEYFDLLDNNRTLVDTMIEHNDHTIVRLFVAHFGYAIFNNKAVGLN